MKKKIAFGLGLVATMFFLGGGYIVSTVETTVADLRRLADLDHSVVFRKELLANLEKIQNEIKLKGTRYGGNTVAVIYAREIATAVQRCLICHHPPITTAAPLELKRQIEDYVRLTREIFAADPGVAVPAWEAARVLRLGDELAQKIEWRLTAATSKLDSRQQDILKKIKLRKNLLFFMVVVGPFFAIGFAFILIGGIAKPVRSLLDATRRLKAGDLEYRIPNLQGEFGEVADSFNEMAAALKKEMQNTQRTEQLKVSGEMAAGLAHEIRNPLAAIKVSMEVLLAELDIEERDKQVLARVIEEIRNIELLMKNLLNFARPVATQPILINVNLILEKTVEFLNNHPSFFATGSCRRIIRELDPLLPETICDPQQLRQVFLNIFLNAADAMPGGGTVTVKTSYDRARQMITVELQDTGKGIPGELLAKLFDPFFTTKTKGTGLGLAVTKRLVEDNGGSITVANSLAGGAVFTIALPVRAEERGGAT